ncbi:MAG: DUF1127 domain-containing protein [Cypionkella sp.]|nr:DUF1127 domain-containing protein [Cypionkella sp.]
MSMIETLALKGRSTPRSAMRAIVSLWLSRHYTRRSLAALTVDQLDDIGLDAFTVKAEYAKPFWRA